MLMGGVGSRVVRRPCTLLALRRASVRFSAVCQSPVGPVMAVSVPGGAPSAPKSNPPSTLAGTDCWGPPVSMLARRAAAVASRSDASADGDATRLVAAASRTVACAAASRMVCQPVQRQRCAASALSTVARSDRSAPRRSWPTKRHTMPGVQKPHWVAPQATNASDHRCCSATLRPAAVVTWRPATRRAGVTHATRGASSTSTVQQPHCPCGLQPSRTVSMPRRSRSTPSRVSPSSGTSTARPSTVNWSATPVCADPPADSGWGSTGLDSGRFS